MASGQLNMSCSTVQEPVVFQGKTYSGWEAELLTEDIIRGPRLSLHLKTGYPSDFEHHIPRTGFGAVDYSVSIGTPIVPIVDAFTTRSYDSNGITLSLFHSYRNALPANYVSVYGHLDKYAEIISKGKLRIGSITGREFRDQLLDKSKIVAFSGDTGVGPGGGREPPHLHLQIMKYGTNGSPIKPGIDPFKVGIDAEKPYGGVDQGIPLGGRPVYWDGKTEIPVNPNRRKRLLQESRDTIDNRVRGSDLDNATKKEILKRLNNPNDLGDYFAMRVLVKKPSAPDGKPRYEFTPESPIYSWMLEFLSSLSNREFIAMLPFIYPELKHIYQKANPNVKL